MKRKSPYGGFKPRNSKKVKLITPPTTVSRRRSSSGSSAASYIPPRFRQRTYGEYGRQLVAGAAGGALGFIGNNVPGAFNGAAVGYRLAAPNLRVPPKTIVSGGMYRGKFKRTTRAGPKLYSSIAKYQVGGHVVNKEVYGSVNSPDCVYITHGTFDIEQVAKATGMAILRKLIKKAGYDITNPEETLPFLDAYNDGRGFTYQIQTRKPDGTQVNNSYLTIAAETLTTLVFNSGLYDYIQQSMVLQDGILASQKGFIENITLRQHDTYATGTSYRIVANLNMKNEIVKVICRSTINVQNRTKSTDGSADANQVDAQPLKGMKYVFKGGVPQTKENDNFRLSSNSYRSVFLVRAAELSPADTFKEPPNPKLFNNCYKSGSQKLGPGDMKKSTLVSTWSGYYNNIFGGKLQVRSQYTGGSTGGWVQWAPGSCEMFAFEEQLNTGSLQKITLSYESKMEVGVYLITGKLPLLVPSHEEVALDNIV